jgi:hypothetical protein
MRSINRILRVCALTIALVIGSFGECTSQDNRPVGTWKDLFPYGRVLEVAPGEGVVYARTEYAVFGLDPETRKISRQSQVQGLSQSNPTAIAVALQGEFGEHMLIVGYANGNIDLLTAGGVYNMPDIVTSNLIGDKGVRKITIDDTRAYLACGFGVVVIDLENLEVSDTWYIAGQQQLLETTTVTRNGNKWVVTTAEGVYEASIEHPFLSSAEAWTRWEDLPESPISLVSEVIFIAGKTLVHIGDGLTGRLWLKDEMGWELFAGWPEGGDKLWGLDSRNDTLLIGRCCGVERYDLDLNLIPETNAVGDWMQIRDVAFGLEEEATVWIASNIGGLIRFVIDPVEGGAENGVFSPDGPENAEVRKIDCWNNNLWFATGGIDQTWSGFYTSVGVHGMVDGDWIDVVSLDSENDIVGIRDFLDVSINPLNPKHVMFGSWEEGLIEVLDGEMVGIWNSSNSTIEEGDFGGSLRTGVGGLDYDKFGNLWFTNAFTNSPLQVRLADGSFHAMDLGDSFTSNDNIGGVKVTRDGYVWVILPRGGGILVYDPAGTPSDTSDDDWRFLSTNESQGGLPSNYVYSIEEDLDGEIWLGTGSGPAIFYRSESLFNDYDLTTASQILIQQDGNYQYLLETETVTSIKIDGGNRKWIGTSGSGVYVLSEDGLTIEHQFSTENSPVPENNILDIAINHSNGEVFVSTGRGTVSYLGEATIWDTEMDNIFVFPNPVNSYHDGPITVDGLDFETIVHITDAAGRVVAVEESMGGRAVWDGLLDDGTPAPYGVYLIFAVDRDGNTTATTKLAITR